MNYAENTIDLETQMGVVDLRSEKEERKGNGTYTHRETYMTEKDRQTERTCTSMDKEKWLFS